MPARSTSRVMESRFGDACAYAHMCLRAWGRARSHFRGNGRFGVCWGFFCFVTVAAEHFSDHPLLRLLSLCHYGDTGCYTSANQCGGKGVLKAYASLKISCVVRCALKKLVSATLPVSVSAVYFVLADRLSKR